MRMLCPGLTVRVPSAVVGDEDGNTRACGHGDGRAGFVGEVILPGCGSGHSLYGLGGPRLGPEFTVGSCPVDDNSTLPAV